MKKIFLLLSFSFVCAFSEAQTFNEWFKQKKTQIKYLVDQIASLEAYTVVLQKGYSIARDGLNTIGDIKNGEFHLHGDFFNALKNVNPAVVKYYRTAAIVSMQNVITQDIKKIKVFLNNSGQFVASELTYCNQVCNNLLDNCNNDLDELITLTTSGELEMSDDERIKRIDALYLETKNKFAFIQSFSNDISMLSANRIRDAAETKHMKSYYDK